MRRITAREVLSYGAQVFDIPVQEIKGRSKVHSVALPRIAIIYCIRRLCPHMSYSRIAYLIGGRDHTTILDAVRRAPILAKNDPDLCQDIKQIMDRFRSAGDSEEGGEGAINSTSPLTQTAAEEKGLCLATALPGSAGR